MNSEQNISNTVDAKTKYSAYVSIYNNLDNLQWRIPAFLIAATVFGIGVFKVTSVLDSSSFTVLNKELVISFILFLWGLMYLLGAYTMFSIRKHHTELGRLLMTMDGVNIRHGKKRRAC